MVTVSICFQFIKSVTQMLVVMGTIKAPFEQKHNLSKEQKRENEITVNMPKALDTHVLDIAIKAKKNWENAGPFTFH